jgi:hypothetical protein
MLAFSREVRDRRMDAPRTLRFDALIRVVVFVAGRDECFRSLPLLHPLGKRCEEVVLLIMIR